MYLLVAVALGLGLSHRLARNLSTAQPSYKDWQQTN